MKKLIIAGGTGFLGTALLNHLKHRFEAITVLTRDITRYREGVQYTNWDAHTMGAWIHELHDCDVLINMTGRSVDCRYTNKNKRLILNSRVQATSVLAEAILYTGHAPKIWINSSTATIYRHSLQKEMDEQNGEVGEGFSVNVAKAWEKAFFLKDMPNTRKIALRTAIVLDGTGGALPPIKQITQFGLGGRQGKGNQKFSWIHIDDFVRSVLFIITTDSLQGPINCVAPKPSTNNELMFLMRQTMGVPFGLTLPGFLVKLGAWALRTESELVLKSRNVIPAKLVNTGFTFRYPNLKDTLKAILKSN